MLNLAFPGLVIGGSMPLIGHGATIHLKLVHDFIPLDIQDMAEN